MKGMEIVIERKVMVYGKGERENLKEMMKMCERRIKLNFGEENKKRSFV